MKKRPTDKRMLDWLAESPVDRMHDVRFLMFSYSEYPAYIKRVAFRRAIIEVMEGR